MTEEHLFPGIKKVLRSAICVGAIVFASSGLLEFPPTFQVLYKSVIGAIFAAIVEFANAYYKKPNKTSNKKANATFFF